MTKYEVSITRQARLDIKMIHGYITNTLMEPVIATKQFTRIEKAMYSLDKMPERFRRYDKEPWRTRDLRVMPVDYYVVLYTVDNESRIVSVIRIMYGRRNINKELDDMAQGEN